MGYLRIKGRYAHRVVWERHFGPIPPGWVVHHKDENTHNNDITNLQAMPRSEHVQHHATGREGNDTQRFAARATLAALRTPKPAICLRCNNGFTSHSAGEVGKFCSRECLEQWRRNKFVPEVRNCLVCSEEYTAVKRFQRYCCRACNNKSSVRTYRTEATGGTKRRTLAKPADVQPDR